jgi:hypothetical protein
VIIIYYEYIFVSNYQNIFAIFILQSLRNFYNYESFIEIIMINYFVTDIFGSFYSLMLPMCMLCLCQPRHICMSSFSMGISFQARELYSFC